MFSIFTSKIAFLAQNYQFFFKLGVRKFARGARARNIFGKKMSHKYVFLICVLDHFEIDKLEIDKFRF